MRGQNGVKKKEILTSYTLKGIRGKKEMYKKQYKSKFKI